MTGFINAFVKVTGSIRNVCALDEGCMVKGKAIPVTGLGGP
jgi:hypothetical protein